MTTGVACPPIVLAFILNNGTPAVNGSILTQVGGLNEATYQDVNLTIPLPNPIPLNARGEVSDDNGTSQQLFLIPNIVYTFTLFDGSGNQIWSKPYVNGIQIIETQDSIGNLLYPPLSSEGGSVVNPWYPYGVVDRYGTNTTPGTTDMTTAVQAAVNANVGQVKFFDAIYVVGAPIATPASGVAISNPVVFQGQGFGTVLLDKTQTVNVTSYSCNMFTSFAAVEYITFKDLTLDGACNNANPGTGDSSEIAMVKITAAAKVTFNNVKLTRYCGGFGGTAKAISASFWEAIVIHNAAKTSFLNCLFADNHYEMVLVWNAPASHNEVLVDGFLELNTGTPNAHSAFDINGGHVTVVNSVWNNTGTNSQLNIQVAESVRVANNAFLSMQPGAAAQCNIGQDTFPYNSNVLVENNYFLNANSAAISVGAGSSIAIRGNVIDTPGNYGIKFTAAATDFATFNIEYPEWPAPATSGSNSITIESNIINAVSNSGSISTGIYFHTVSVNGGFWFKDVRIRGNTVTAGSPPNNTFFGLRLDDMQDLVIRDNWLQYTDNGVVFETLCQNVLIDGNTFSSVPPNQQSDIIWIGAFTSSNVKIRNNQFDSFPVGQTPTVDVFAGTVSGLDVIDNVGIHPTLPVTASGATSYVARQTRQFQVTSAPAAGDYGINDVVKNVPTAGSPGEYICIVPGSFGVALSCTATGATPNDFFTCNAIGQIHVGQHFKVAGAGVAAADLTCTCVYITGSTFYIDQVISTSVTNAVMTLVAPTFVKSANYT